MLESLHEMLERKKDLEVELATTRIALKKARRSIFLQWNCGKLRRQEGAYEEAIAELGREIRAKERQ